jgi:hypothetical protein
MPKFEKAEHTPKDEAVRYFKRLAEAADALPSLEGKSGASVRLLAGLEVHALRREIHNLLSLVVQGDS